MENEIAYFWLILLIAYVTAMLGGYFLRRRGRGFIIRHIQSYQTMPLLVDEAVESDLQLHVGLAGTGIGQANTLIGLAALSLLYEISRRQSFTNTSPVVTVTDGLLMVGAGDVLRQAYAAEDNAQTLESNNVVWLPTGQRSFAYGAGAAVMNSIYNMSNNIMVGTYGIELALIGAATVRRDTTMLAQSTQLTGQAVAYAQSEAPLIGEELFAGNAYLYPDDYSAQGRLLIMDVLRWVVVAAIILIAILNN